jgi:hypothetical protein
VAPYYSAINSYGPAVSIDVTIIKPPAPTITIAPYGASGVKLTWTEVPGSLPISSYEVRYSKIVAVTNPNPTWDSSANTIQTTSFNSLTLTGIKTTDPYRYFVAAKDTAGLVGSFSA